MKFVRHLPVVGIATALCLFIMAAGRYPGGTMDAAGTVGYSWAQNFVSALFAPEALNGAPNPARTIAVPALFFLCAGIGVMFYRISTKAESRFHRKMIEIGGIGAAVYGLLVATPMHNLVISIGLLFYWAALLAMWHMLYIKRRRLLFGWGIICIALSSMSAAMYYGEMLYGLLPMIQKLNITACVGWITAVYYTSSGEEETTDAKKAGTAV